MKTPRNCKVLSRHAASTEDTRGRTDDTHISLTHFRTGYCVHFRTGYWARLSSSFSRISAADAKNAIFVPEMTEIEIDTLD